MQFSPQSLIQGLIFVLKNNHAALGSCFGLFRSRIRAGRITAQLLIPLFLAASCGRSDKNGNGGNPQDQIFLRDLPTGIFDQLQDPAQSAPGFAAAARSVVKIERPSGVLGTGFFLGDGKTLITNAHVLGPEACFSEGCSLRLHTGHYVGAPAGTSSSIWVTLVPYAYSAALDLAAFRTSSPTPSGTEAGYEHPFFLPVPPDANGSFPGRGSQVALLGHSSGHLLKVSPGKIAFAGIPFVSTELLTLPGTSGGPIVDESGAFWALHHRGTQNLDYMRNNGYFGVSLSSRRESVMEALKGPQRKIGLAPFRSAGSISDERDMRVYAEAVLSSKAPSPYVEDRWTGSRAEALWQLCVSRFASDEDNAEQPPGNSFGGSTPGYCQLAVTALSCSKAEMQEPGGPVRECPDAAARRTWQERFSIAARGQSNSEGFFWMMRAPVRIVAQDQEEIKSAAATLLPPWLEGAAPGNGLLGVGDAAAAMDVLGSTKVGDVDYTPYFESFRRTEGYHFEHQSFMRGLFVLAREGKKTFEETRITLAETRRDPLATLGDVLLADYLAWRLDVLGKGTLRGAASDSPFGLP
jgi:hypothetical protein